MRYYLLLLSLFIFTAHGAITFTVLDPIQAAHDGCSIIDYLENECRSHVETLTYHAQVTNTDTTPFTIDAMLVDDPHPIPNQPNGGAEYFGSPTGYVLNPGETLNFIPFQLTYGPVSSPFGRGTITLTLVQNSPAIMSNSQTITYSQTAPEPATALPVLASVAAAAIWCRRRQWSRS
jgi:hypothetical protein